MIEREVTIGNCRLIQGNSFEVMRSLDEVDHIMSDPPYAANTHKMAKTNKGSGHGKKLVTFGALTDEQFGEMAGLCLSVARGWVVMTCDYMHAALMYRNPAFVRLGAWVKPNPMPQISADRPGQGFETVLIMHSGKTRKVWNRGGGSGVWTFPVHCGAEVPTQKPMGLAMAFVRDFTQPGETVLDPFCGSGTNIVAAVNMGRSAIGIEADPKHFDIAVRRVTEAHKQQDLFVAKPAHVAPVQESLL